jgi:dephospho-CoA kinase
MENKKLIIGLTGTIASGKGIVRDILKSRGFHAISLGDIIREELSSRNMPTTRKNQQDIGNNLRREFGGQVLVERALQKYKSYDMPIIIDGIRNMVEIDFLKNNSRFFLIGVDAPFEIRWQRIQARNKDPDLLNPDKFVIDDARDRGFNEPLNGQQTAMCLVHADFLINNDENYSKLEDSKLYRDVNDIYREIMKRK